MPPDSQGLGGGTTMLPPVAELALLLSPISKELAFAAEMLLLPVADVEPSSPPKRISFLCLRALQFKRLKRQTHLYLVYV